MTSVISRSIYEPDTGVIELVSGKQNFVPSVPRGSFISTKDWEQESFLRMLINHSEISVSKYFGKLPAYEYEELVDWVNLKHNVRSIMSLENDQTLIIENGKVFEIKNTDKTSPKVIVINSNKAEFSDLSNLKEVSYQAYNTMQKQSYMDIGMQDIIEDNYLAFNNLANKNYYGDFDGKIMVTSGFGYTGASQALAMNMNHGVTIIIDIDRKLVEKMYEDGFCNIFYEDIDSALDTAIDAKRSGLSKTIGLVGNASEILWDFINKGFVPNIITDRTNTKDNYFPSGYSFSDALRIRRADAHHYKNLVNHTLMTHVKAMLELQKRGSIAFEFGNNIREKAYDRGLDNAFNIESFIPEYIYPVITSDKLNFKWIALSGNTEDVFVIDDLIMSEFSDNKDLVRMVDTINKVIFQKNIPARKVKLDADQAIKLFKIVNEMIRSEELSGSFLIDVSSFKMIDNTDYFKQEFITEDNQQNIINKIIEENQGSSWVSINQYGNANQYYNLSENMILLDGSKESELNLINMINLKNKI